jgi:hypothetical protein
VINRYVGNLPPMPGVFPDYPAPVVRNVGAEREMVLMRWGMPATAAHWRAAGHRHPQYLLAAARRRAGRPCWRGSGCCELSVVTNNSARSPLLRATKKYRIVR